MLYVLDFSNKKRRKKETAPAECAGCTRSTLMPHVTVTCRRRRFKSDTQPACTASSQPAIDFHGAA